MTATLHALCFDANDPRGLARFWAGLLGWETDGDTLTPEDDIGFRIRFAATAEKKSRKNHAHFDLTSESLEDQRRIVAKALELGGRPIDIGQSPEEEHVVLADPEGNEFCVIEPGNTFLAECGFVGALACDGSQEVGYFWSKALDWPLVWDRDQETAIRSPHGGRRSPGAARRSTPRPGGTGCGSTSLARRRKSIGSSRSARLASAPAKAAGWT